MTIRKHAFYPGDIPEKPGCYLYRDLFGTVIYVGKAANLRRRMSQYFQPSRQARADAKLRSLINSIETWEFITVNNEDESLILESRLIKEYAPHYNVLMRDDKRLLMLKIDKAEKYPRLRMARLKKDDSCLYFGPFPKGGALRITAEFLIRHFGLRTCKSAAPCADDRAHCLAGTVRDCCCPCIGKVTEEEYMARVEQVIRVLNGDTQEIESLIRERMKEYAQSRKFEKAAHLRDVLENLSWICDLKRRNFSHTVIPSLAPGPASVTDLQNVLHLPVRPDTIECFDISNISGTLAVASLVHFTDGRPDKQKYRRFRIRTVEGPNDFAMMEEAITRHFTNLMEDGTPLPSLLMVDGGKGQLSSAIHALAVLNCPPFPVIGLAKKQEEVFFPGQSEPVRIPLDKPAIKLLQAVRDEAHRFAITYHRLLRLKTIKDSILDEIPGIGEVRKKALLKAFGSVRALRKAVPEEIVRRVDGIGMEFAQTVYDYLRSHAPDGAVDPL